MINVPENEKLIVINLRARYIFYQTVFTYFPFYQIETCLYFAILMYYIYALGAEPLRSLEMTEIYIPK